MRECARHPAPKYIAGTISLYITRYGPLPWCYGLNWKSKLEEDWICLRMQTCSGKFDNIWKIARDIGIKLLAGHLLNIGREEGI